MSPRHHDEPPLPTGRTHGRGCTAHPAAAGRHPRRLRGGALCLPIEGWRAPLRCADCGSAELVRVDLVEQVQPLRGQRRPWGIVLLDPAPAEVDAERVHARFFRCGGCDAEWPVATGTRFMVEPADTADSPSPSPRRKRRARPARTPAGGPLQAG